MVATTVATGCYPDIVATISKRVHSVNEGFKDQLAKGHVVSEDDEKVIRTKDVSVYTIETRKARIIIGTVGSLRETQPKVSDGDDEDFQDKEHQRSTDSTADIGDGRPAILAVCCFTTLTKRTIRNPILMVVVANTKTTVMDEAIINVATHRVDGTDDGKESEVKRPISDANKQNLHGRRVLIVSGLYHFVTVSARCSKNEIAVISNLVCKKLIQ